jgi:hypothetical protein
MQGKERCKETHGSEGCTRRDFIKFALATTVAGMTVPFVHAQGKERLRVGLIGCGGRGTGAALDAAAVDPAVEIYALGDLFKRPGGRLFEPFEGAAQRPLQCHPRPMLHRF